MTNSILTLSSSDRVLEAAFPLIVWRKRAIESRSWRWDGAGRQITCREPVGRSIAGSGARIWPSRLLQHAVLPARDNFPWLRRGRRIDHLRLHFASPPDKYGTAGSWAGLADWKTKCPVTTKLRRACWVSLRTGSSAPPTLAEEAAEAAGCGHTFYRTSVGIFQPADGEPGQVFPDPFFGGEGPNAHCLHRLRRMHDGLPPRRQEHAWT